MGQEQDKVRRVKSAILSAANNSSLQDIIDSDAAAFRGVRMLYSTESSGAELQVQDSARHLLAGIFSKRKLLAYSDSISEEMKLGVSKVYYKRRILFDTNLLTDLPRYFLGEELSTRDKVAEILSIIETEYSGGFDYVFSVLENLREFVKGNNPYPVRKVAAAIYLDHLVRGEVGLEEDKSKLLDPYFLQAESLWASFRSSQDAWNMVDRRDSIYFVMLETFYFLWSRGGLTMENTLNYLVDRCLNVLGVLPLKELYFAWKAIIGSSTGYYTPVFDEPDLKRPTKGSIRRIGALSWDLYVFRFIEMILTEEKGNGFYVPTFTTLDKGLLATIYSCPAKAMISFGDMRFVETIFEDELLFQQCLVASLSMRQKKILTEVDRGVGGDKKLRYYTSLSIADTEKKIMKLVS